VTAAVSLPMIVAEFDDDKQETFKKAIAAAAGVSSANVTIVKIESISSVRQEGATRHVTMRHLLAAGIRIEMSIKAANQNAGDTLVAKRTVTAINTKLQQAGLPVATILEEARTAPNGDATSTSDADAVGGMLPLIIGAAAGLAVLLAIAFFFYRRYRKKAAETKRATAVSELVSVELGMLSMAPVATVQNIEARLSASIAQRGKLCVDCGVMNEVSNEIYQDCRKSLHREDVADDESFSV